MKLSELKDKLLTHNVPEHWYSLNEGLKPDACILVKNYSKWEYFYLDEKGDRNGFKIFINEEEAFEYFWKKIEGLLKVS